MKHDFHAAWKRYNFALKNRNKLIKISPIQHLELDYWDEMLSVEGERLSLMRQAVFSELIQSVQYLVEAFSEFSISEKSFNLHFNPGWDQVNWHLKGKTFQDYLISRRARDHKLGYTLCGPHKSEVVFRFNGEAAQDKLSRGQRKWLSFCLKCAQVKHLSDQYNKRCLILIDDFSSELDKGRQTRFLELLSALKAQVILTSIYKEDISFESNTLNSLLDTLEMFHVEHGKVA